MSGRGADGLAEGGKAMSKLLDVARGAFSRLSPGARMRLGRVLKYVPTDLQYGSTYRDWRRRIEQARTDPGGMAAYRDQARIEIVASVWNTAPYYRETLERAFGSGFDPASVVDDAVWQAIPVLEGPTVHVESPRMCVVPASRLDLTSTGGSSGQPVKFFIDRHRGPIEIAFLHDAWSVAGYRTGDARAVFRGFEIDETGERSFVFDPGLNELRCSVFRLTDPVMQGFHDAILARGIRLLRRERLQAKRHVEQLGQLFVGDPSLRGSPEYSNSIQTFSNTFVEKVEWIFETINSAQVWCRRVELVGSRGAAGNRWATCQLEHAWCGRVRDPFLARDLHET